MVNKLVAASLLLVGLAHGQSATFRTHWRGETHGGYNLQLAIGANKRDVVVLEVICNHPINNHCFLATPTLDGQSMVPDPANKAHHQIYTAIVGYLGDHHLDAVYSTVGPQEHYKIDIDAWEALK